MQLHVAIDREGPRCPFENESVRMELGTGECLWLKGNSGVGKSSIVLHLIGLRELPDARVELRWTDIQANRSGFGMVFQQGVLIDSLNVGENIGLALRAAGLSPSTRAIRKALTAVGLAESDAAKMPGQLSGGMLRRASLAQVLAQGQPVIILDEPFVGLDEASAREIVALIQTLMERGHSFILISHETQFSQPLATPGREVELRPRVPEKITTRKRMTPHWKFVVRTGVRLVDYLVISAPMILFAFMAAGVAISMLFSDLLQATSVDSLQKQIIDPKPSFIQKWLGIELFKEFVGREFASVVGEHLPAIRRRIFALGISRGFIIELGPLLTALLLAGRIGGSYAGEVSMMQATNQNQLLQTLGVSPRRWTLGPAAIAAMVAAPLLTALGVGTSLMMARIVALSGDSPLFANSTQYWQALATQALDYEMLWTFPPFVCAYHSLVFMFLILFVAEISARLRPNIQPRGVPKAITWAVVGASLLIIIADWGLSQLLFYLSPINNVLG